MTKSVYIFELNLPQTQGLAQAYLVPGVVVLICPGSSFPPALRPFANTPKLQGQAAHSPLFTQWR